MEIYVLPKKLRGASPELDKLAQDLSDAERHFRRAVQTLDWKVRAAPTVNRNMQLISEKLNRAEELLQKYSEFVKEAALRYEYTDDEKSNATGDLSYEFTDNRGSSDHKKIWDDFIKEHFPWLADWTDFIRDYIDKYGGGGIDFGVLPFLPLTDILNTKSWDNLYYAVNDYFKNCKDDFGFDVKASTEGSVMSSELEWKLGDMESKINAALLNGHASASSSGGLFKDGKLNPNLNGKVDAGVSAVDLGFESKYGDGGWDTVYSSGNISLLTAAVTGEGKCYLYNDKGKFEPTLSLDARVKAAVADGEVKVNTGDSTFGADLKGSGTLLGAEAGVSAGFGKIKDKNGNEVRGAKLEADAMAYLAKGEVEGGITIMGVRISGKMSGYAGAVGAKVGASVTENGVTISTSVAAALGVGGDVSVDWSGFDDWADEKGEDFTEWVEDSAKQVDEFIDSAGDKLEEVGERLSNLKFW